MIEIIFLYLLAFFWISLATFFDIKSWEIPNWLNFSLIIFALGLRFFYSLFNSVGFNVLLLGLFAFLIGGIILGFFTFSFKSRFMEIFSFIGISSAFLILIYFFNFSQNFFNFFVNPGTVFLYSGILGLMIFFILGNLLYYGRMFSGGDTKLMVSLGAVLPVFSIFSSNLKLYFLFFLIFLLVGALYGIFGSIIISIKRRKRFKEGFKNYFKKGKKIISVYSFFGILFLILGFWNSFFLFLGIFVFLFPYLYFFFKSVDEFCMIKSVPVSKLTPGDLLYKDVRVGKVLIKSIWDGLSENEISILKKRKGKVLIRYGLQFTPVFLMSFLLLWAFLESSSFNFLFKLIGF